MPQVRNQMLDQIEANIERQIPKNQLEAYQKIVTAGLKLAYSDKLGKAMMTELSKAKDPVSEVVKGSVGIILVLYQQSGKTMPLEPIVPAGMALVLEGLDVLDKIGKIAINAETIDRATEDYIELIRTKMGVTDEQMAKVGQEVEGALQQPGMIEKLEASNGAR